MSYKKTFRKKLKAIFNILILSFFIVISPGAIQAVPRLVISDYNDITDFSKKNIVLIQKGDNLEYKNIEYDDSEWAVTSFPSSWHKIFPRWNGICWYRMYVNFPEYPPMKSLGISLGIINNVDELYFNGKLIGSTGKFPPIVDYAYDKFRIYEIPTELIKPGQTNLIAIRVSGLMPKENGPSQGKFKIAPLRMLQRNVLFKDFIDVIFSVIYLTISLYFIVLFMKRSIKKEHLFFSLFSICSSLYFFLRTQFKYFLSDNFVAMKRVEYILVFVVLFFMMEYITYYFKRKNFFLHYAYLGIIIIALIPIFLCNNILLWKNVLFSFIEPAWLIPVCYCFFVSIKEFKKDAVSIYLVIMFPIMTLLFINDVLVDRKIYDFVSLSNYGFIIIIIGTSIIMGRKFTQLNKTEPQKTKIIKVVSSITNESRVKIEKAITYLDENFTSDISREGLAEHVGMNPDYFGKQFKQFTGLTINDYINERRIELASNSLLKDNKTVTEIAFAVGFESLSTFYRVFNEIVGETPADYKEKNKIHLKL